MKNLNVIHIANITKRTVNSKYPPGQSQTHLQYHPKDLSPPPRFVRETPPIPPRISPYRARDHPCKICIRFVRETIPSEVPRRVVLLSFLPVYLYLSLFVSIYLYSFCERDHPQRSPPVGRSFLGRTPPCAMRSHPRTRHTRPPALLLCLFFVLSGCGVPRLFARVSSFHVLLTFLCFFICARKFFHFYFIDIQCVTNKRIFH